MGEQSRSDSQRWTTIVGVTLIILAGLAALTVMVMTVKAMSGYTPFFGTSRVEAAYKIPTESTEMHFTPGFHHFETIDEAEYLNALTQIDTYGADGKTELVDVSIVYSAGSVSPHYHITYKVWLN